MHPLVSVITPTANRPEMLERCIDMFRFQDYTNTELIIIHDENTRLPSTALWEESDNIFCEEYAGSIGGKRNHGAKFAHGEIILHMDDDDLYAPDWITKSVAALIESKADIVGLHGAYFYKTATQQVYELIPKPHAQTYLCGATLCYWKHVWERKPFKDTNFGEDTDFISNNGRLYDHKYKEGFIATVHGNNTICHKSLPLMHKTGFKPGLLRLL